MGPKADAARLSHDLETPLPDLRDGQPLDVFVRNLAHHVADLVDTPRSFDHLRAEFNLLGWLVEYLGTCQEQPVVSALLILRWHYSSQDSDDLGLSSTRGLACEIIAWRFLSRLDNHDRMNQLLCQLPDAKPESTGTDASNGRVHDDSDAGGFSRDTEALLGSTSASAPGRESIGTIGRAANGNQKPDDELIGPFLGWNALEIGAVADAKKFLSQKAVQNVVTAVWNGDIIFWENLQMDTKKHPQYYRNARSASIFSRLRVPKYVKIFEAVFFASFLALYYAVLLERAPMRVTATEVLLYVWIAAFAYDEFGEYRDVGSRLYTADIWNLTDLCILLIAGAFIVLRIVGLVRQDSQILEISMDVFSLEALLLVPRICALLSLHPFIGTLLPCLKKMSRDFVNFLGIVLILYIGFLTTFTMLARDTFTPKEIAWYLVYVFFGSSYLGFDIASEISELLGPPLMIVFVCMTNILLITSLISLLSNTLDKVMDHAREEYLFQYSVFVLEASASRRLTYFFPPFNLVPLILVRPLRLFLKGEQTRSLRIMLLKIHLPYIAVIWLYERWTKAYRHLSGGSVESQAANRMSAPPLTPRRTHIASRRGSKHARTPGALSSKSDVSLIRTPGTDRGMRSAAAEAELHELKHMITGLSEQVRELAIKLDAATAASGQSQDLLA